MKKSLFVLFCWVLAQISAYTQTHTITASANTGGTITPSGAVIVSSGANQTFNIAAKSGFLINNVSVDGISQGALTTYTFTNVTANHTIAATFSVGPHLALNKPAWASTGAGASNAVDTDGSNDSFWSADPYPQWWKVDLQGFYDITSFNIRNYVDSIRYYHYNIQVSLDNVTYTQVVDKSNNIVAADDGDAYTVSTTARFIKVNVTYNSFNPGAHISDFRVYGTPSAIQNIISSTDNYGGTISPAGTVVVLQGTNRTFNVTLKTGYQIGNVLVDGSSVGTPSTYTFTNVTSPHTISVTFTHIPHLALNKPASSQSFENSSYAAPMANDDDGLTYWASSSVEVNPQWWKVDLGYNFSLTSIVLCNFYGDGRYYQYNIEASADDVTYTKIAEKTNTNPSVEAGDTYILSNVPARYLRVNTTYNSAHASAHILDFRVYGTAALTISGVTANNKVYDGTTSAALNTGSATLAGVIGSDNVTLVSTGASGTFSDKNIGTGKPVTTTGFTLNGTEAWKYTLIQPTPTANITAVALTITGITANDKVYNGNMAATLNGTPALSGVIGSDTVTLGGTPVATFSSPNVADGITVTVTGYTISGTNSGNYTLTQPTGLTADITPLPIVITPTAGQTRVYGQADPSPFTYTFAPSLIGTDVITGLMGRSAGTNAGNYAFTLGTLTAGSNYSLSVVATPTFSITPKDIVITAVAGQTKVYGQADPSPFTYTFAPSLVGTDVITGLMGRSPGTNVGNYTFTLGTLTAGSNYSLSVVATPIFSITPKTIIITPSEGQTKVYGQSDPVFTYTNSEWSDNLNLTGALGRDPGENVGSYAYTLGTLSAGSNYSLVMVASPSTFDISTATGIDEQQIKNGLSIKCYPNPFDGYTIVNYSLPFDGLVTLTVSNLAGQVMKTVVSEMETKGEYRKSIDNWGSQSGVYVVKLKLKTNDKELFRSIKLVKGQ